MAPKYRRPPTLVGAAGLYGDRPLRASNRAGSRAAVGFLSVDEENAVFERPRRTSLETEVSMRSGTLTRPDITSGAWRASPLRTAASGRRVLSLGQLIRSIVLVAASVAIVAAIAFEPAQRSAGGGAPNDRTAWDRPRALASFIFPYQRMALDQPGAAPSADRARHAN